MTGGAGCAVEPCLVYCGALTDYNCYFGGDFCSDALAANAWNARLGTNTCHACCGLADCENDYGGWGSDAVCMDEIEMLTTPP